MADVNWDDSGETSEEAPPRVKKAGMSTGVKVLLILLAVGGIGLVVCCGAGFWFGSQAFQPVSTPEEVAALQAEIVDIALPETLTPSQGLRMNMGVMKMQMVMSEPSDVSQLMLMQMQMPGGQMNEQQAQAQFQQQFSQQGGQEIRIEKSETRPVTIEGKECDFQFAEGKTRDGQTDVRQITGAFPGKDGMAILMLRQSAADWNEEQIMQMLEGIKTK